MKLRKTLLYIQCFKRAGKGTSTSLPFRVLILMTSMMSSLLLPRSDGRGLGKNVDHHCINFQWSFCDSSRSQKVFWFWVLLSTPECYCIAQAGVSLRRTLTDTPWPDPGQLELIFNTRTRTQLGAESLGFCASEIACSSVPGTSQQLVFTDLSLLMMASARYLARLGDTKQSSLKWVKRQERDIYN